MKSQADRVKDAAAALAPRLPSGLSSKVLANIARAVLEAADREPPSWPDDEFMGALFDFAENWGSSDLDFANDLDHWRPQARDLLGRLDVIKASVAYRDSRAGEVSFAHGRRIIDAVNEAGL